MSTTNLLALASMIGIASGIKHPFMDDDYKMSDDVKEMTTPSEETIKKTMSEAEEKRRRKAEKRLNQKDS